MKNIVLNIPHSSKERGSLGWDGDIRKEIDRWTDVETDRIFSNGRCAAVIFPYSRFWCDAERLPDDKLGEIGQGICYTSFNGCRRDVSSVKGKVIEAYMEHRKKLQALITEDTLVIDCHSFPEDLSDTDICIGYNEDWSKPEEEFLNKMKKYFEGFGYSVAFNEPYSNSITPPMPFHYKSVMIELNKRIYMHGGEPSEEHISKLNGILDGLYKNILKEWTY